MKGKFNHYATCLCGSNIAYAKGNKTICSKCGQTTFVYPEDEFGPIFKDAKDFERRFNKKDKSTVLYSVKDSLRDWKEQNHLTSKIGLTLTPRFGKSIVTLTSNKPGILIGFHGATINQLKDELKLTNGVLKLEVKDIDLI